MKKLLIISEKIESSNNNYFGRGSFETIIKNNKDLVLSWFENLTSIQNQIRILNDEYGCENLQKRNYVRIITKLFAKEYSQFVCLNILLRDIDSITLAFLEHNDSKKQYELLILNNRLKFPGKHKKVVDFDTYQQFITLYANDLIEKSQDFETDENLELNISAENNIQNEKISVSKEIIDDLQVGEIQNENQDALESQNSKYVSKERIEIKSDDKDKTNWMNVLLKGI